MRQPRSPALPRERVRSVAQSDRGEGRHGALSEFYLFGDLERVVDLDAEVADRALQFRVAKE
jgi:hypothetical protein